MTCPALDVDHQTLAWALHQGHVSHDALAGGRPDFLVISPPKTGSTWLADNLRHHPGVFVPTIKEVKYFSSYYKWLDLAWYLAHFAAGSGRVKGEASPSYALLPVGRIRLIRRLLPDVKLIFLMRDPVARAWSHAKHTFRYREANFAACALPFEAVSDGQWRENFRHEWTLASGDYLGQLRRWLSVFPREQFYVGFYESIAGDPHGLLRDVFRFLGVPSDVDLAAFPARERILPGLPAALPRALEEDLRRLLSERTRALVSFLSEQFGLRPPAVWGTGDVPDAGAGPRVEEPAVFRRDRDDCYVGRVLGLEEAFPGAPRLVLAGYRGHDIFFFRGELYALARDVGCARADGSDAAESRRKHERGRWIAARSLAEAKERVDERIFERSQQQARAADLLRAELGAARDQIGCLQQLVGTALRELREAEGAVRRVEARVEELTPWYVRAARRSRWIWRRLRDRLRARRPGVLARRGESRGGGAVDRRVATDASSLAGE
jgi:hypothetical protein